MELEKIKEIIEKARAAAKTEEFSQLVDHFEAFVLLFNQKDEAQGNPEFLLRLDDSHRKFWGTFEKVSASFGLTPEAFKAYFKNPSNFSPQQWDQMQTIQREIAGEKIVASSPKKLKNNKKMRV